jgi:hypothetical protein
MNQLVIKAALIGTLFCGIIGFTSMAIDLCGEFIDEFRASHSSNQNNNFIASS